MTRINTNVSSLNAQNSLARSNAQLQQALTRLSTGLQINTGKDDPAGLIASEVLRSDITSVKRAISNNQRANQMIATADSALGQVSSLLNDIRGLVSDAANEGALSDEQIAANQSQIDSSLEAIDRLAQVTAFQGKRLLDGSLDFITEGVAPAVLSGVKIDQANFGTLDEITVNATVVTQATKGTLTYDDGDLAAAVTLRIGGKNGYETFSFASGTTLEEIEAAVDLVSDAIGVEASIAAGPPEVLSFTATQFGSDAFVSVEVLEGTFETMNTELVPVASSREAGTDVDVRINGIQAVGKGLEATINTSALDLTLSIDDAVVDNTSTTFTIVGGGAKFQLGPDVVSNQQSRMGIAGINTALLGGVSGQLDQLRSGGDYDLTTDAGTAANIVEDVINQITTLRGRLGAFQKTTLSTNIAALGDTLETLTDAESSIRDADFAAESASLTRAQILVQSGTSVLAVANSNPQNVLSLLRNM